MKFSEIIKNIIGEIDLKTLEGRILYQKKFYFLQKFAILKDDYSFSFFIYGPYSSTVAKIGFEFVNENKDREIKIVDSPDIVDNFKKFLDEIKNDASLFELLASIHFLRTQNKEKNKEEIFNELILKKPYLGDKKVFEWCWNLLEKYFIF